MTALARGVIRPASLAVIGVVASGYALLFLWLAGDIAGGGRGGFELAFPAWERVFESRGAWRFESVGIIEVGPWVWTFSPLDTLIALGLGGLLGANLAGLWQLRRTVLACPVTPPAGGLLAGLPALLAGGACCAPLLVVWLGWPLAGSLAVLAPWLVPLSYVALAGGSGAWRSGSPRRRGRRSPTEVRLAVWLSPPVR